MSTLVFQTQNIGPLAFPDVGTGVLARAWGTTPAGGPATTGFAAPPRAAGRASVAGPADAAPPTPRTAVDPTATTTDAALTASGVARSPTWPAHAFSRLRAAVSRRPSAPRTGTPASRPPSRVMERNSRRSDRRGRGPRAQS